jgi:hypothetical protein
LPWRGPTPRKARRSALAAACSALRIPDLALAFLSFISHPRSSISFSLRSPPRRMVPPYHPARALNIGPVLKAV